MSTRLVLAVLVACTVALGCSAAPQATGTAPTASVTSSPAPTEPLTPTPSVAVTTAPEAPSPVPSARPSAAPVAVAWSEVGADAGPSGREDHTWTVDPATGIAYLFGGRDGGTIHDDLWAYDLAADRWAEVEPASDGPSARFGHEAVWVDGLGLAVWAGQAGPTTFFDDLWAFDPGSGEWTRLPNEGERPVARYGSCAAVGPDGRLWISHGFTEDGTRFADTRAYDFELGTWSDETPSGRAPVNRCLHGCWWTDGGELALYAGQTTGVQALGDLWSLAGAGTDAAAWNRVEGALPEDRNLYAFAPHGDDMVVFGGRGLGSTYHRDVFTIDASTLAVEPLTTTGARPPARSGATLIDDPERGRVVLFGGRNANRAFDDTWQLTLP